MKKLNQKSDEVTVVIEVSFKENFNEVKNTSERNSVLYFLILTTMVLLDSNGL